jgi:hypothetical protein
LAYSEQQSKKCSWHDKFSEGLKISCSPDFDPGGCAAFLTGLPWVNQLLNWM